MDEVAVGKQKLGHSGDNEGPAPCAADGAASDEVAASCSSSSLVESAVDVSEARKVERDRFGAVKEPPGWVTRLLSDLEGTAWTTGADRSGKWFESLNVDVYGYDEPQGLAVVQVRQYSKKDSWDYANVRKDWYLVGRNENLNPFAHPIDTVRRKRSCLSTVEGPVRLALSRIWGIDEDEVRLVRRNGDVALVPTVLPKDAELTDETELVVAGSHRVKANKVFRTPGGGLYVQGRSSITHLKRQHGAAVAYGGTFRVQVGMRANNWGFTRPSAD